MIENSHSPSASGDQSADAMLPETTLHCGHFRSRRCRSCQLLDNSYNATLRQKHELLAGLFPGTLLAPFVPCHDVEGSRIRAKLAVTGSLEQPHIGFYDDRKTIVAVNDCPLHHGLINDWTQRLPSVIREYGLTPYDMLTDRGELKFVVFTCSPTHLQLMIQFVLRSRETVDRIRRLWRRMTIAEKLTVPVMSVNLQPVRSSMITGTKEIAISEQTHLPIHFSGTELLFGPQSFVQTNHEMAVKLYAGAGRMLQECAADNVLDLYCGVGAFSLTTCSNVRSVTGIDISTNAIACAHEAVRLNNRNNAQFLCRGLDQLTADQLTAHDFDTVICNPPRRGLDRASVTLIQTLRPRHLVYSSCNPVTLQRDIQLLAPDYELDHLEPFDMFPFTPHFEVLAKLLYAR